MSMEVKIERNEDLFKKAEALIEKAEFGERRLSGASWTPST